MRNFPCLGILILDIYLVDILFPFVRESPTEILEHDFSPTFLLI